MEMKSRLRTFAALLLAMNSICNGDNTTQVPSTITSTMTTMNSTTSASDKATAVTPSTLTVSLSTVSEPLTATATVPTNTPVAGSTDSSITNSSSDNSTTAGTVTTTTGDTTTGTSTNSTTSVSPKVTTSNTERTAFVPSTDTSSTISETTTTADTEATTGSGSETTEGFTTNTEYRTTTVSTTAPESTTSTVSTTAPESTATTTTAEMSSVSETTTEIKQAANDWILPFALVLFVIVLIIFVGVAYMYYTGKEFPCLSKDEGDRRPINPIHMTEVQSDGSSHMIYREDFETNYRRKAADDGFGFRQEFKAIQTERSSVDNARSPENAAKNRYDNVVPYDSTRVRLSVPPNGKQCEDFINANFVPGYLQEKKFIACQGPKENTCGDFWKMMWEQNCATIVMVTNLVENNKLKCHQYWPGSDTNVGESSKYGSYQVTLVDVKTRTFYVTRTFKLQFLEYPPRIIRQMHYIAWPDFGVPKNAHEMLQFRRRVVAANPPHSGPIVVHCSAGVGRTGTFILVDAAMEQLHAEGKVDLFSFLTKMRKYRMMLVQTDAQYTFAHAVILEHIKYGETEIPVKKFRAQVQSLREQVEDASGTLLEEEFDSLLKVQFDKENMKHGRQSIKKNRVLQIIPYDNNRVVLPLKPGQERTDYINASLIEGFKVKEAFIATQGPLQETIDDFWMMAWVKKTQNIVMLTSLVEKGQDACARYWPEELNDEETHGDITVKFVHKDDDDVVDYIVREFTLTRDSEERKIRQFHYTGWPEVGLPSDAHGMIEIANRLNPKDKSGNAIPSIVHCSSGGGRTGVFIALNILMEQADSEGLVDVFQTVKSLRAQRPHIIQTQDQLYFCYAALLQYLETNQLAGDNATLSSNVNSSIGNLSSSVAASNGVMPPSTFLRVDNTTPQGSMNNKLDATETGSWTENETKQTGKEVITTDLDAPDVIIESAGSPATQSGDSASQSLLKDTEQDEDSNEENTQSSSSNSDFEIVNENAVKV